MLIGQASINLAANVLSALLGFASVFAFTRLFSPHEYGVYLLGVGFASVVTLVLIGWFRNLILNGHARNDDTDVRGLVVSGYLVLCLATPLAYGAGRLAGLDAIAALTAVVLAVAVGLFELTQDLVRARLMAFSVMKATVARAIAALALGVAVAMISPDGSFLLLSAAIACLLAAAIQSRTAWRGTAVAFDWNALWSIARTGLPLTLSIALLGISSVIDRFVIANLVGTGDAGRYVAGLDLVRQTLMMPAMSAAAAFFPLAIQTRAKQGDAAVRSHLGDCVELLLAITLPAAMGFALISTHIANVVLGVEFRELAAQTMPVIAVAVVFQILTQQYLHASFLLSERNSFYLINTATIIAANLLLSLVLVSWQGAVGAAWARLGADIAGFLSALILSRLAFRLPLPPRPLALVLIASLAMSLIVGMLEPLLHVSDLSACVILAGVGVSSYACFAWMLDVAGARRRLERGFTLFRTKFAARRASTNGSEGSPTDTRSDSPSSPTRRNRPGSASPSPLQPPEQRLAASTGQGQQA